MKGHKGKSKKAVPFVVWSEVMAPLANAVGFVNHNACKQASCMQRDQGLLESRVRAQALRRDVQQISPHVLGA